MPFTRLNSQRVFMQVSSGIYHLSTSFSVAWSDEIYIFQNKNTHLHLILYTQLDALTSCLGQHIQNNQWIYYLIPVDTGCEEAIRQGGHKPSRSISRYMALVKYKMYVWSLKALNLSAYIWVTCIPTLHWHQYIYSLPPIHKPFPTAMPHPPSLEPQSPSPTVTGSGRC